MNGPWVLDRLEPTRKCTSIEPNVRGARLLQFPSRKLELLQYTPNSFPLDLFFLPLSIY